MVIGGVVLGGCVMTKNLSQKVVTPTPSPVISVSPMPTKTVELSEQSKSGMTGTVTFVDEGGKTRISIKLLGKGITGPLPAHVHLGSCPNVGMIKYPLNDVKNGSSDTLINSRMIDLFGSNPMAVNIHKSIQEATIYTACGDLK